MARRIRAYQPSDHRRLGDVCVRTAYRGGTSRAEFSDASILPNLFVFPYLALEPELAIVSPSAENEPAVGYLVGTRDTNEFVRWYRRSWLPPLAKQFPPMSAGNTDPQGRALARLHQPEYMIQPGLDPYPAHLHIGILPAHQGIGIGRELIESFVVALRARNVPGVHVGISSTNPAALAFFLRMGFRRIDVDGEPNAVYLCRKL
jgi:ribosomal protein S18 acetylase RimI-like enzyme